MNENKHEPDEARENETRPDDVDQAPGTEEVRAVPRTEGIPENSGADTPDTTEVIEEGPAAGGGPVEEPPAVTSALDADAVASAGSPTPAGVRSGQAPYVQQGVSGPASGQGAPAAPVRTAQHPNPAARPAPSQGPRVGTVVWGLVVLAIGLGVLAAAAGARIDVSLAAILLLGGAGVALVAGSIVSSFRRRGEP